MVKAILFDLGGVLVEDVGPKAAKAISSKFGVEAAKFLKAFENNQADFRRGKISEDELWIRIAADLKVPKPRKTKLWFEAVMHEYNESDEVFAIAKKLRRAGYKTVLISNTEEPIARYIDKHHKDESDLRIYSCFVGMLKPDREIYDLTLNKLGVGAGEAVLVDDKTEILVGTSKLGMKGILFENDEQLLRELRNLGIKI